MNDVPPFHQAGEPDGHFFALAFSRGRYVSASGTTNKPAFLVLYFSNSVDFAPFSCMTVSSDGEWLAYQRGDDVLRTIEFAILRASETEGVPTGGWTLYPRTHVEDRAFPDERTREAYWESRRRLCTVLYPARAVAAVNVQFGKVEPLFRHDGTTRHLYDGEPDNEEISEAAQELVPDSPGEGDQES